MAASRRAFLGGALAGAASPLLGGTVAQAAKSRIPVAQPKTVRHGRALAVSPDGRTFVVAHDRRRTIGIVRRRGSRVLDVGGQPVDVAISPDGRLAAVTTGAWDEPGLTLVDLRAGRVSRRVDAGTSPFGLAFADRGRRLIVVGGEGDGLLRIFDSPSLALLAKEAVGISPIAVVADKDDHVWVSVSGQDRVTRVSLDSGRADKSFSVPSTPDRLALSADGRRLLVTHGSLSAEKVSEVDLKKGTLRVHRAGRLPSAVAWARGDTRLVALAGAGEVVEIGKGGRRKRHAVGGSPRDLAVARGKAWTVDHLTGDIKRVKA
jgi:dipeptidyl aminopeptidase/acylaminoacyl peptidase